MASLKVLAGERAYLVFLSLMVIALVLAVFVALWKHDYKKWDVKARAIVSLERLHEAQERSRRANKYLTLMRRGMLAAVLLIAVGFGVLLLAAWSDSFVGAIQAARSWVCPSMPVK
jgi:sterol desaturase/sphingolipid hydroxylase (fatty acid hydroxylase superfamily)